MLYLDCTNSLAHCASAVPTSVSLKTDRMLPEIVVTFWILSKHLHALWSRHLSVFILVKCLQTTFCPILKPRPISQLSDPFYGSFLKPNHFFCLPMLNHWLLLGECLLWCIQLEVPSASCCGPKISFCRNTTPRSCTTLYIHYDSRVFPNYRVFWGEKLHFLFTSLSGCCLPCFYLNTFAPPLTKHILLKLTYCIK